MSHPSLDQVRTLPLVQTMAVPAEYIDENGHMNILQYIAVGTGAAWQNLKDVAMGPDYIAVRGHSFFTVGHHMDYLGEMREGDRLSVHTAFAERDAKVLRGVAAIVDDERDRLAFVVQVKYVHVSMDTRRATAVPDDVAALLDAEIAQHPWLAGATTGLTLGR